MQNSSCRKHFKGLYNFIQDIRCSTCKAEEACRVEEELTKIRLKFHQNKNLKTCELMKCIWKLIYCYMLGYQVPIGRFESIILVASSKYSEKQTGYIACSLFLKHSVKMLNLLSNSVKRDLKSRSIPIVALALNFLANSPCGDIVDHVFTDVVNLTLFHKSFYLQGRAYLVLLYFFRNRPSCFDNLDLWVVKIIKHLEKDIDKESTRAIILFTRGLLESTHSNINTVRLLTPIVNTLSRVVFDRKLIGNTCYGITDPWMQINLLQVLQFFPSDIIPNNLLEPITRIVRNILTRSLILPNLASSDGSDIKNMEILQNRRYEMNIIAAIFFEAINVLSVFSTIIDATVKYQATDLLLQLCSIHNHNIRYLALQSLSCLTIDSDILNIIYPITQKIITQLDDPDVYLGYQAIHLLCKICQKDTYNLIFSHLFKYLTIALHTSIIEDLLMKMIYLVEEHSENFQEYIDTVFILLSCDKTFHNDKLWRRVVQVITQMDSDNNKAQAYAAYKAFTTLMGNPVKKQLIKLSAYLLGEFGHLIYYKITQEKQYKALCYHLYDMDPDVIMIFLIALLKVGYDNERIINKMSQLFYTYSCSKHLQIAQRAQEFIVLLTLDTSSLETILACMPHYSKELLDKTNLMRPCRNFTFQKAVEQKNLQDIQRTQEILLQIPKLKDTFQFQNDTSRIITNDTKCSNTSSSDTTSSFSDDASSKKTRRKCKSQFEKTSSDMSKDYALVFNENVKEQSRSEKWIMTDNASFHLWFQLCISPKGLLCYESPVQAFVYQTYNEAQGQLHIIWKNITQEPIFLDSLTVEPCVGLAQKIMYDPTLQNVAILEDNSSEVQHIVTLRLTRPFLYSPRYFCHGIYKNSQKRFLVKTALPTCIFSYIVPTTIKTQTIPQGAITETYIGQCRFPYEESIKEIFEILSVGFHMNVIRDKNKLIGHGLLQMKPDDENCINISCSIHVTLKNIKVCEISVTTMDAVSSKYLCHLTCSYILTNESINQNTKQIV